MRWGTALWSVPVVSAPGPVLVLKAGAKGSAISEVSQHMDHSPKVQFLKAQLLRRSVGSPRCQGEQTFGPFEGRMLPQNAEI